MVSPPRFLSQIEAGFDLRHPLILIFAPAGYGKSALAAGWRAETERSVAWLAFDESDKAGFFCALACPCAC